MLYVLLLLYCVWKKHLFYSSTVPVARCIVNPCVVDERSLLCLVGPAADEIEEKAKFCGVKFFPERFQIYTFV